jgi:hypothetical protein
MLSRSEMHYCEPIDDSSIDHIRLQFLRMGLNTAIPDSTTLLVCRYYRTRVEGGSYIPPRS